jgi:Uma2 family endonuclease
MARTPLAEQQATRGALILNVENVGLTSDQFLQLCSDNRDLRFELTAQKELVIMPPPGANTSRRNVIIITELTIWARKDGTGITFDPACWFILPNGANRSPDAAWLKRERWDTLPAEVKEKGAPLCPEFVVELMSPSDRLAEQKEKMEEYVANGALLGWLIDPAHRTVYVYRPGAPLQTLENPSTLSGEPILPGFVFNIPEIW